jgi:hypothetical protein
MRPLTLALDFRQYFDWSDEHFPIGGNAATIMTGAAEFDLQTWESIDNLVADLDQLLIDRPEYLQSKLTNIDAAFFKIDWDHQKNVYRVFRKS